MADNLTCGGLICNNSSLAIDDSALQIDDSSLQIDYSALQIDDSALANDDSGGNQEVAVLEADSSELLYKTVRGDDEAYNLYNEYAFSKGFSVRKGKNRRRAGGEGWTMRRYLCSNAGVKDDSKKMIRGYDRVDIRTNCKAFVQFSIGTDGVWTCSRHEMVHNHEMVPVDKRHLLRSQRKITDDQRHFMSNLTSSGIKVSDAVRVMSREAGGSPMIGFTKRDAYNAIAADKKKELEGSDCKHLIKIFAQRQAKESDFFYEFELDDHGHLISFFWRDSRMKRDYQVFGDLVVFDTTYRTNKYGMICAPFVGMNHHCNNVMFGMGFILNERIESFIWLFESFLSSVGGSCPITMMTDQCAAMAAAIKIVMPNVNHRLCTWHLGENSAKNIGALRSLEGFCELFNYLLKYVETAAEFEHYWNRMLLKYGCSSNGWLHNLYMIKEKWCPAYSKDYFSGGVLSSQRSESTNHSISHRLKATHGLSDFYTVFLDVISDWRSRENGQDFNCLKGNRHLAFANVSILSHAREVYTIEVYKIFEEEFIKGTACDHDNNSVSLPEYSYYIWRPKVDLIKHQVCFNKESLVIRCTCKYFSEMGILCSHSLRVYHLHCVGRIPDQYIVKRWCKTAMTCQSVEELREKSNVVQPSVWRAQKMRFLSQFVMACADIPLCRDEFDSGMNWLREKIESIRGPIKISEVDEEEVGIEMSHLNIKDPPVVTKKYERNIRPKGAVEKARNKANAWRKRVGVYADYLKSTAQSSVQGFDPGVVGYVHPMVEDSDLVGILDNGGVAPVQKKVVRPQKKSARKKKAQASGIFANESSQGVDEQGHNVGPEFIHQDKIHDSDTFQASTSRQSVDGDCTLRDEVHNIVIFT